MSGTTRLPQGSNEQQRRIDLLAEAVSINSVNPLQAGPRSGPGGEAAMANWLAERCRGLGAEVELDEKTEGRPNVYAHFPGTSAETICVDVHLDTVGIEHMTDEPFDGRVEHGKLFGRGSVDTKATLAVVLALLESIEADGAQLRPNLLLVGSISEEIGGLVGAFHFADWIREKQLELNSVIVAEPTMCAPVHGHKGGLGLDVTLRGLAAHSSKPELGANAIAAAARVIDAYVAEHEAIIAAPAPTPVGTGTLSVTMINGGLGENIIPDSCTLHAGRRIAPGEDPLTVFDHLKKLAVDAALPLEAEVEITDGRYFSAFYQDSDSALVTRLSSLAETKPEVATYGTNALAYVDLLGSQIHEIVVFGPGSIDQAHKASEWVDISQLDMAGRVYRDLLLGAD